MANEFTALNGYKCKDKTSRNLIDGLNTSKVSVDVFNAKVSEINDSMNQLNEDIESTNTRFDTFAESVPDAANEITYDNTDSGLEATNVQEAINELKNLADSVPDAANEITYDNTDSGLEATNVQSAIDEIKNLATTGTTSSVPDLIHPTTSEAISTDFTSGGTHVVDVDCWVCARAKTTTAEFACLYIVDSNAPLYSDKEFAYGINNRTMVVKLYVKKGTSITVNSEGNIGTIELYKLV